MGTEKLTSKERAALQGLVAPWNALGVGEHPPKVIGRWLMEHMKPAIDQIRDVLQQPDEPPDDVDMSHLNADQLRRVVARHVRWRESAMRLLIQVHDGFKGKADIEEFVQTSTTRLIPSETKTESKP